MPRSAAERTQRSTLSQLCRSLLVGRAHPPGVSKPTLCLRSPALPSNRLPPRPPAWEIAFARACRCGRLRPRGAWEKARLWPSPPPHEIAVWAGVAQLVEHLICNQRVGGSNPFVSSSSIQQWHRKTDWVVLLAAPACRPPVTPSRQLPSDFTVNAEWMLMDWHEPAR